MREGRKYCQFGDIASFSRGLTFAKGDVAAESTKKVLRSNNIDLDSHSLNLDDIACLNEDFDIPDDKKLHRGDVFVCMSNGSTQHLGKVAFIEEDMDYAFGGFMGAIHPDSSRIYPKYVYYSCISSEYRRFLASIFNGVNINNLKWSELSKFSIPFPSLPEQERIVTELDLLTGIIDKQKAQLKELDNLAQSIFYDMFGDPVENEKGWQQSCYGEQFTIGSGGTPSKSNDAYWNSGTIPWIGSNMCQNCIINKTDGKFITEEGVAHSSAKLLDEGTVLVALVGATIGKVALLQTKTCTNQNIAHILVQGNKNFAPIFVYYQLQSLYSFFMELGNGDFKMANLSFIRSLPIILPPLVLQQSFAEKIQSIESQKASINRSIEESQKLFDYTMDKYFN